MNTKNVSVWYDHEGDILEVIFERKEAVTEPTEHDDVWVRVDDDGSVVGFSIFNVSKLDGPPLDLELKVASDVPRLVTTEVAAEELGISIRRLQELLAQGRVKGAQKARRDWLIPVPVEIVPGKRGPAGVAGERPSRGQSCL